jgi:hypothetical protein
MERESPTTPLTPPSSSMMRLLLQILTKRAVHQGRAKGYNELLDELQAFSFNSTCTLSIYLNASQLKPHQRIVLFSEESQVLQSLEQQKIFLEHWKIDTTQLVDNSYLGHVLKCYLNYLPAFGLFQRLKRNLPLSNNQLLSLEFIFDQHEATHDWESASIAPGILCSYTKNVAFRVKNEPIEQQPQRQQPSHALSFVSGMDENYFCKESALSLFAAAAGGGATTVMAGQQIQANYGLSAGISPMPSLFRNPSSLSNRDRLISMCPLMGEEEKEIEKFITHCQELLCMERCKEFVPMTEQQVDVHEVETQHVKEILFSFLDRKSE